MNDSELLRSYLDSRSPEALTAIVERYRHLVYSAALRQLRDSHMADDATQAVFIVLIRKANTLAPSTVLPAWLLTVTRYVACDALRAGARRTRYERSAAMNEPKQVEPSPWMQLVPLLDEAVTSLPKRYRDVVVLRYFERQEAEQIAQQLGLSNDAVRKRLSRGIAKLREMLAGQGVTMEAGALVGAIAGNAVQPSAGSAAALVAGVAHAPGTSVAAQLASGAARTLELTKLKFVAALAVAIGVVTAGSVAAIGMYRARSSVYVPSNVVMPPPAVAAAQPKAQASTPLILAVERANAGEVRRLLDAGADPNEVPARGDKNVALIHAFAVREPRLSQIVASLVEHGADVNVRHTQWGYTPIYMAAASGSANCVKYLLAHGADPTLSSKSGQTPLDRAKEKGDAQIVELLQSAVDERGHRAR